MKIPNSLKMVLAVAVIALMAGGVMAAPPSYTGTYQAGTVTGTLKWTPTRGVQVGYYLGNLVVNGASHTGYIYYARDGSGRVSLGYNDVNGNPRCGMVLTPQADGTLSGPINFYNRNGVVTGTGIAVLK